MTTDELIATILTVLLVGCFVLMLVADHMRMR